MPRDFDFGDAMMEVMDLLKGKVVDGIDIVIIFRKLNNKELSNGLIFMAMQMNNEQALFYTLKGDAILSALILVANERLVPGEEEKTDKQIQQLRNMGLN